MQRNTSCGTLGFAGLGVSIDDGVDTDDDLEDTDMDNTFGMGREGSLTIRFVDDKRCTSAVDNESSIPFGIPGGI